MVRIVTSPVSATRRAAAMAFLEKLSPDSPLVTVAPDRGAAMEVLRQQATRRGALYGWETQSLAALANRRALGTLATRGLSPAPPLVRQGLCAQVLAQAAPGVDGATGLGRFEKVAAQPGFPAALAQTFDELALEGVSTAQLRQVDGDLAELRAAYEAALQQACLVDLAQVYALATEVDVPNGASGPGEQPAMGALLLLDVPLRHRLEAAFAARLIQEASSHLVTLPAGDVRTRNWLTASVAPEADSAGSAGGVQGQPASPTTPPVMPPARQGREAKSGAESSLRRLQHGLFGDGAGDEPATMPAAVQLLSAPGEARECVEIARRILWAAADGIPFERMAILPRRSRAYHDALSAALGRAGVPVFFTASGQRPDPSGRALLALLACRAEGCSAKRFAEYLSLEVVPDPVPNVPAGHGQPPTVAVPDTFVAPDSALHPALPEARSKLDAPDAATAGAEDAVVNGALRRPARWEQLLVNAAVIGGESRWRRRLQGLAERLRLGLDQRAGRGEDTTGLSRQLEDLEHLRDFALPVIAQLSQLPASASWDIWLAALKQLALATLRRPARVLSVLAEAAPLSAVGALGLQEVRRTLQAALSELPTAAPSQRAGRVFVGDAQDARGRSFDIVFVPGLCEKTFPEKLREDPLLLDQARERITSDLITNRDRASEERLCLRLAVGAAERRLVLSYPRIDGQRMRPRVPSFYGLEVLRAAEGRLPGYSELMARAERTGDARIDWPAPRSPHDAIDAAEHDLAVLDAPLRRDQAAPKGQARYLLRANPHLARSLRFRARRWALPRFNAADGLVDPPPAALAALSEHRPSARPYSATALEAYASCPYRFFLRAIVGIRSQPAPTPVERLGPLEAGALFHSVQSQTLSALRASGAWPITTASLAQAQARLDRVLDNTAEQYRQRLAPAVDRVFDDGIQGLRADLRQWLARLAEDDAWTPAHFELAFGLGHATGAAPGEGITDEVRDSASVDDAVALPSVGLTLRGAIDLVETRDEHLRATDHKTGPCQVPEELRIGGGTTLQPALYGLALRALFPGQPVDSGRLYFCTTRGGFEQRTVPLDAQVEAAVTELVQTLDTAIGEGFLPAAPAEGACERCDYRRVCGPYEEQRLQRKRADRLQPLLALRRQP